jgi:EpsI family protein
MMTPTRRVALCGMILACGLVAQAALERTTRIDRPPLRETLRSLPLELGDWVGRDVPVPADILRESQATEYLNRVYESRTNPGRRLTLWINFSREGLNLRHSPKICLPSGGWEEVESLTKKLSIPYDRGASVDIMRLGYSQGELVQLIGFWYYIFGEGTAERYVRNLPITNRSSHGRTTRGSGLTVEVFCTGETDPDGAALEDFARPLLRALEPIMPRDRAEYFVP